MGKQKHPTTYINLTITKMQSYTRIEVEARFSQYIDYVTLYVLRLL